MAWKRLVLEFKERADIHLQKSDLLKKQLCDPLSAYADNQKKEHKAIHASIDKSFKTFVKASSTATEVSVVKMFIDLLSDDSVHLYIKIK